MHDYPIFLDLQDLNCLVVGGGTVAERKTLSLLGCGARILLISPRVTEEIERLAAEGAIEWVKRGAEPGDLDPAEGQNPIHLAFLCSNSRDLQRRLAQACRDKGILANVADSREESTFYAAGAARRGALQIAVSTDGECPSLAQRIRKELEKTFDPAYEDYVALLGEIRREDIAQGIAMIKRRRR